MMLNNSKFPDTELYSEASFFNKLKRLFIRDVRASILEFGTWYINKNLKPPFEAHPDKSSMCSLHRFILSTFLDVIHP